MLITCDNNDNMIIMMLIIMLVHYNKCSPLVQNVDGRGGRIVYGNFIFSLTLLWIYNCSKI